MTAHITIHTNILSSTALHCWWLFFGIDAFSLSHCLIYSHDVYYHNSALMCATSTRINIFICNRVFIHTVRVCSICFNMWHICVKINKVWVKPSISSVKKWESEKIWHYGCIIWTYPVFEIFTSLILMIICAMPVLDGAMIQSSQLPMYDNGKLMYTTAVACRYWYEIMSYILHCTRTHIYFTSGSEVY